MIIPESLSEALRLSLNIALRLSSRYNHCLSSKKSYAQLSKWRSTTSPLLRFLSICEWVSASKKFIHYREKFVKLFTPY